MGSPLSGLRLEREDFEKKNLSSYAMKSAESRGRKKSLEACDLRTDFQRDRDRITHSKAFRRLMHKTQVFISPDGDHYRTRLTHTLEVAQIARTMARALKLNEDLTEAIALGHDIGHTPFGHTGEEAFADILPGFCHNEQSVRVCEVIERDGEGLNLTYEVLDGILNHRGSGTPGTLEGKVVQISDKIAYINHDIDDAIRAGQLNEEDLPADCTDILGKNNHDRIDFLIRDVITVSMNKPDIVMTEYVKNVMYDLRQYMYDTVYTSQLQMKERKKISGLLKELHRYYADEANSLPDEFKKLIERGESCSRAALDYVACMTDRFALSQYTNIFMPANSR